MTRRFSDQSFLIGAVQINISIAGISIREIATIQPENASEDVIGLAALGRDLAGRLPSNEYCSCRGAITHFVKYPESSYGSFIASFF